AHTTFTQFLDNAVMGDSLADHGRCESGPLLGATLHCGHCAPRKAGIQELIGNSKISIGPICPIGPILLLSYNTVSRIFFSCASQNSCSFLRSSGRLLARIATAKSAAFTAPGLPIASVATGIPPGI